MLVVAAHPDDEILGAGATLARHVDRGDEVHACVLVGGCDTAGTPTHGRRAEDCGKRAAEVIGLSRCGSSSCPTSAWTRCR